jgi:Protein of unknown function (DUF3558)
MRTPTRTLCIALASLLLVAGCSTREAGQATAGGTSRTTTDQTDEPTENTSVPTSPSRVSPKRPEDIDLASVNVCGVLKKVPVRRYGLDGRAPVGGDSSLFPGSQDCFSGGIDHNLALTLVAVRDKGASEFTETANAQVTEFDAEGYPLYVLRNDSTWSCFGVLDVHDGQFMWISYGMGNPADRPVTPLATLCKTVPLIAASTVSALR